MQPIESTIFALASGAGRAGVAVMRISGPCCPTILEAMAGRLPQARRASLRNLREQDGGVLDQALVLWFPAPASYTGEACAELHLHGGPAVIAGVSDALLRFGARPAEPGEFTKRAFLNGRLDLTEAEAVVDLIEAETSAQRVQALRQLGGALGRTYEKWRGRLLKLVAQQEALVDFPDEELPQGLDPGIYAEICTLRCDIASHLQDGARGERLRRGICIVVSGAPNVGKSTLVNYLAKRDVAIVSPQPGTTRDVLETRFVIGGVPVTLIDTAGLRASDDPIEAEGVRRATERARSADIVIRVQEAQAVSADGAIYPPIESLPTANAIPVYLDVASKTDLVEASLTNQQFIAVSAMTGAGMQALSERLTSEVARLTSSNVQAPLTRERHRAALAETLHFLEAASTTSVELRAEALRLGLRSLGRVTGRVDVEDILGQIFSEFCIGK